MRASTSASGPPSVSNAGLPPCSCTSFSVVKTGVSPRRLSVVRSASRSFLSTRAAASRNRSKTSGRAWPRARAAVLPTSTAVSSGLRSLPRKKIAPESNDCLRSRFSSSRCRRRRTFSSATSAVSSRVWALRSLRERISRERNAPTVSRSMAPSSAATQKSARLSRWLRARASATARSYSVPASASVRWNGMSPSRTRRSFR